MPQQAGGTGDADHEQDGARREQKAEKAQKSFMKKCPAANWRRFRIDHAGIAPMQGSGKGSVVARFYVETEAI